jgi:hypothetical protein
MSRVKSKTGSKPKSREPIARDYADLLAKLPPKKPPATSVRQRQKLSPRRSG